MPRQTRETKISSINMYMRPFQSMTPRPSLAEISSAATMVVNEFAIARRMPVRMNGTVAGSPTKKKICAGDAPSACAARILFGAIAETPAAVLMMTMKIVV
jgi:hypothetical protein